MADELARIEPISELFDGIIEVYRHEGFDAGYRRASQELLASLVLWTEEFLGEQTDADARQLRKALYGFVDCLERQIIRTAEDHGYVEGGLGI